MVFIDANLPAVETQAKVKRLDFKETGRFKLKKETWMMMALTRMLEQTGIYPLEALKDVIAMNPRFTEQNLAALEAGKGVLTR